MDFKTSFLQGECEFEQIHDYIDTWHNSASEKLELYEFLGLSKTEYEIFVRSDTELQDALINDRQTMEILTHPKITVDYTIYQVKNGNEYRGLRFAGLAEITGKQVDICDKNYDNVYSGTLTADESVATSEVLDSLFTKFNTDHPHDFKGHSLSVSDVISIKIGESEKFHFVDSVDFREIKNFNELQPQVSNDCEIEM